MEVNLICIGCPMGCMMHVEMEGKEIVQITGNTCKRGEVYARKEVTAPTRILTSSVHVNNGIHPFVSVKTQTDIPKGKLFDVMKELKDVSVEAPVSIGDVIVENIADTRVNIVATRNVKSCKSSSN